MIIFEISCAKITNISSSPKPFIKKQFFFFFRLIDFYFFYRAGLLLQLQSNIVHVLSWHQPTATISVLLVYAIICLNPHLLVGLPLLLIIVTIMAPGYNKRHPLPLELTPTQFFRHKLGHSPYDAESDFREEQELVLSAQQQELELQKQKAREDEEYEQRVLRERLRDLQNLLSGMVLAIEGMESFVARVGSFADEERATAVYLVVFVSIFTTTYFASFVPISAALLAAGWTPVLLLHPTISKKAKYIKDKYIDMEESVVLDLVNHLQEHEIIIDEPPETREVEIFELQRQGLTSSQWTPWVFTTQVYDLASVIRRAKERPSGTRFLGDVEAPPGWIFSDEYPWKEDTYPKDWVMHRGLRHVEIDLDTYWVYDYYYSGGASPKTIRRRRKVKEKKKRLYAEYDADEYYFFSDDEDTKNLNSKSEGNGNISSSSSSSSTSNNSNISSSSVAYDNDSSDDCWYDGDEYYKPPDKKLQKELDKSDVPLRGEWRRRRWVRQCFRISEL